MQIEQNKTTLRAVPWFNGVVTILDQEMRWVVLFSSDDNSSYGITFLQIQ